MESQQARPSQNLSDDLTEYIRGRIESAVAEAVPARVAMEEDRRFRQLKWMIALVGLVGLGTFGTLSNYLIEKAVESRLEARTGNITDSLDFIRFNSIALKLDLGTSFSRQDRDAVMTYLRRTAKNDRVRYSPEFLAALTQVMESFVQANQTSSVDEIFDLYKRELVTTDTIVEILIHHYGQEAAARSTVPGNDKVMQAFEELEAVANGAGVGELALVYRTLLLHSRNRGKKDSAVEKSHGAASLLEIEELSRFYREILQRTASDNWQREPTLQGKALEEITRDFLLVYAADISRRTGIEEHIIQQAAQDGVHGTAVKRLATQLALGTRNKGEAPPQQANGRS